jgi:hypothetical protein
VANQPVWKRAEVVLPDVRQLCVLRLQRVSQPLKDLELVGTRENDAGDA